MLALFETLLCGGVIRGGTVERGLSMRAFFGGGFFDVGSHPIEHLAVDEGFFDHFNHLFMREARGFEPHGIESFSKIGVIIRMQFSREMQSNLVDITRKVHPAIHDFARTARINNFAHARIIQRVSQAVN